jgi:hypothetical protein
MTQLRGVENLVQGHQRDLMATAGSHRATRPASAPVPESEWGATQRSAAGLPVAGGRTVRRLRAPRLGAWMIHFGTRLGGASVRTS